MDALRDEITEDVQVQRGQGPGSVITLDKDAVWQVKDSWFTAVFPAGEEPDPALVAKCREYDPNFVVVWGGKVMVTPAHTEEVVGNYVICRYVPSVAYLNDHKKPIKLQAWPANFPFDPTQIFELHSWTLKWPKNTWGSKLGLPEPALPFDGRVVEYVRAQEHLRNAHSLKEILEWLLVFEANQQAELRKIMEEGEYALKQEWRGVKKAVEEGAWGAPPSDPKPFTEMPKNYRKDETE